MRLSICIPTHQGRAAVLREALDSVLAQVIGRHEGRVEICVSDNGSLDDTKGILTEYAAQHPAIIRTHRFKENQGGHVNFLKIVDMAVGEYCWLLGSDDQLAPGALDTTLDLIQRHPDVAGATCLWRSFDALMLHEHRTWAKKFLPKTMTEHLFTEGSEVSLNLGMYLMYMSVHIFRRSE